MTAAIWEGRAPWKPWAGQLPAIKAENAAWSAEYGPRLKAYDEAQRIAREEAAALAAEQDLALKWCQANGNPHRGKL